MTDENVQESSAQRALLVGIRQGRQEEQEVEEYLNELAALADTLGVKVAGRRIVRVSRPSPRLLMGSGNADEIASYCREHKIELVIFDEPLSPAQQRNWEKLTKLVVIDRQEVILDIFAARASTREAELQIELAQAEYQLPRLKRAWTHLNRQEGRVGIRAGEGEKQIEIDSRLLRRRIAKLKKELVQVRRRRAEQRKKRQKVPVPNAAIVGYTNAGKSCLFNRLTDSSVLVEDKLFATLDPTTRRLVLPNNQTLLLTDTVGFVRKLPHDLVEAFKATLEEAAIADYLIHVVDASSPQAIEHYQTTLEVLGEIGAGDRETITVFNKIDLLERDYLRYRLRRRFPDAVFISARTGEGLDELVELAQKLVEEAMSEVRLCIPPHKYDLVAWLHRTSRVISETHEGDAIYVTAAVRGKHKGNLRPYEIEPAAAPG